MIVIVDYGMGNLGSIQNMLRKVGAEAKISAEAEDIERADKLILPGVGAFDTGMLQLRQRGLIELLNRKALEEKTPILGVCLGMQLMGKASEEGRLAGLGWLDAECIRFRFEAETSRLKIPHMGWNTVSIQREGTLFKDMPPEPRFYFVHSYHLVLREAGDVLATTEHGYAFVSAVQRGNIMAVQFHPEKSHKFGMRLYKNFVEAEGC